MMSFKYLDDILEYSNELPEIFHSRLGRVKALDMEVSQRHSTIKNLKDRTQQLKVLIGQYPAERVQKSTELQQITSEISLEYDRILQYGAEKVKIIEELEQMMGRWSGHLDGETEKFKMELEVDYPGITDKLEAQAYKEMEAERRMADQQTQNQETCRRSGAAAVTRQQSATDRRRSTVSVLNPNQRLLRCPNEPVSADHQWTNASTQTLPRQRNYCPSSDSSDESVQSDVGHDLRIKEILGNPARGRGMQRGQYQVGRKSAATREEKLYCFCGKSEDEGGFMVACDNRQCQTEWFHGLCVGVQRAEDIEKKKWYCPQCERLQKSSAGTGSRDAVRMRARASHSVF
ncbi:uncharacterized protein LOC129583354 [Paramacrobiotus metropolitanus]|uniref:uncharacterized protein LOC129583354 n=1 Tax=Paramacrobiotus metropolitanus TaxID=2943436 RepID=UPI00244637D7|nr:uncharacterized protein LOC129583354 [Paramacrobiotus metropolitanus]